MNACFPIDIEGVTCAWLTQVLRVSDSCSRKIFMPLNIDGAIEALNVHQASE
jgi:hypothetical protein